MIDETPTIFQHFDQYGGITDFTDIDESLRVIWRLAAEYLENSLPPARIPDLKPNERIPDRVCFVKNGTFNAAIRHEEGAVAAAVFAGVPMVAFKATRLFALRMDETTGLPLCDGKGRLVIIPDRIPLSTEWAGMNNDPSNQALNEINQFEEETDLKNNELATFMFDIAMRYVAMHECMHFVLGHARYCQIN